MALTRCKHNEVSAIVVEESGRVVSENTHHRLNTLCSKRAATAYQADERLRAMRCWRRGLPSLICNIAVPIECEERANPIVVRHNVLRSRHKAVIEVAHLRKCGRAHLRRKQDRATILAVAPFTISDHPLSGVIHHAFLKRRWKPRCQPETHAGSEHARTSLLSVTQTGAS